MLQYKLAVRHTSVSFSALDISVHLKASVDASFLKKQTASIQEQAQTHS